MSGVTDPVIDAAVSSFLLEIMANHGEPSPRLCNKDPYAFVSLEYLSRIFPNAKFVLMLRDGRAIIHSVISRNLTEPDKKFPISNPRKALKEWNKDIGIMYDQCLAVGEARCYPMHYERLILQPEYHMSRLLNFFDLPWNDSVLNHEEFIGTEISMGR